MEGLSARRRLALCWLFGAIHHSFSFLSFTSFQRFKGNLMGLKALSIWLEKFFSSLAERKQLCITPHVIHGIHFWPTVLSALLKVKLELTAFWSHNFPCRIWRTRGCTSAAFFGRTKVTDNLSGSSMMLSGSKYITVTKSQ